MNRCNAAIKRNTIMNATLPSSEPIPLAYATPATASPLSASERLVSLDAFRGLVMILMASAGLSIPQVAKAYPNSAIWQRLAFHTDHVAWAGCGLWDLIQPCFMFMVGAAIPFSLAKRQALGQSPGRMMLHALWRAVALTALGVYLASSWSPRTNWIFSTVLAQIGMGYFFLFLLAWARPRWQLMAAMLILLAYWGAFALYPAPAAGFDFATVNAKGWTPQFHGFAAHWEKNTNLATAFDRWFLNLFPRKETFVGEPGGYATLNFIPSLATMIFGLLAGGLLRSPASADRKIKLLIGAGVIGIVSGLLLDWTGLCPSVKRIWTPSWTLFSGGCACIGLAVSYAIIDVARYRAWSLPLVVVGMNSIAMYVMSQLMKPYIRENFKRHLGDGIFTRPGGETFAPLVQSAAILAVLWLVAWWMYRRRLFLKI
jgi:heparan-alpha-glucosaminide N-acetyltransferase